MMTTIEALLMASLGEGMIPLASGDVESPTGYFAAVRYLDEDIETLRDDYSDVFEYYGDIPDSEIVGFWAYVETDQGIKHVRRLDSWSELEAWYVDQVNEYQKWYDAL